MSLIENLLKNLGPNLKISEIYIIFWKKVEKIKSMFEI